MKHPEEKISYLPTVLQEASVLLAGLDGRKRHVPAKHKLTSRVDSPLQSMLEDFSFQLKDKFGKHVQYETLPSKAFLRLI